MSGCFFETRCRYNVRCSSIILTEAQIQYASSVRYLGVVIKTEKIVVVHLLKCYCLPFLLYASEAVLPSLGNLQTSDNGINTANER